MRSAPLGWEPAERGLGPGLCASRPPAKERESRGCLGGTGEAEMSEPTSKFFSAHECTANTLTHLRMLRVVHAHTCPHSHRGAHAQLHTRSPEQSQCSEVLCAQNEGNVCDCVCVCAHECACMCVCGGSWRGGSNLARSFTDPSARVQALGDAWGRVLPAGGWVSVPTAPSPALGPLRAFAK